MKYAAGLLLESLSFNGNEIEDRFIETEAFNSLEECIANCPMLSFVDERGMAKLKRDEAEAKEWLLDENRKDYLGELGGIWCCEFDGLEYAYDPEEVKAPGVFALYIRFSE